MAGSSPVVSEGAKKARIEIIPLIDVIFFLLATFVLFTLSLKHIRSIPLQLPVASAFTQSNPDDDLVTIQVSDKGTCYWDEHGDHELISVGEIQGRIDNYKRGTTNPRDPDRGRRQGQVRPDRRRPRRGPEGRHRPGFGRNPRSPDRSLRLA